MQNSANEKNEIDFPERGCLSHFLLEAEVVKKQIQQEQYTGKGGIYQQLTLPISENILIDEHEPVYVANAQLEELPALLDARENQYLCRIVSPLHCF